MDKYRNDRRGILSYRYVTSWPRVSGYHRDIGRGYHICPVLFTVVLVSTRRAKGGLPKYLTVDDMSALLRAPTTARDRHADRDRAMLHTMYRTGMRVGELVACDRRDVDLDDRRIVVRCGKGGKGRVVPVDTYLRDILSYHIHKGGEMEADTPLFLGSGGGRMTTRAVQQMVDKYGRRCGIHVTPHTLRHTMAVHRLQAGMDVRVLQMILGHSHINTTMVYLDLTGKDVCRAGDDYPLPL